ncbi:MAG: PQQ-binding-like beta-propeller repeat protein [Gemmataceae bacterium]
MPRTLTALAVLVAAGAAPAADNYPAFRGDGNGRAEAKNLPVEWSPKALAWKVKLPGYGQSSPVVHGGKVFVTAVEGPNKEKNLVAAYDLATGKELWKAELPATQTVKSSFSVARAAPTPVADAQGLYVFFESGELARLTHDGKTEWLRSLVKEFGPIKNGHQLGSSLAQTDDLVFALVDHEGPSYLLAADKKTGMDRWKVDRPSRISWTSPVVLRHGGKALVLVSSGGSVDVYDAATGQVLSTYAGVKNNNVPSATAEGDRVVVGASDPPRGGDRETTLKSCCCLALDAEGKLSSKPLWHSEKATASFASPLIYRGCVYYLNTVGVLACLDLKTGKEHYSERTPGGCWASPVAAGDRVYLFGRNGVTTVVRAGPKFERLATNRLWDEAKGPAADAYQGDRKEKGPGAMAAMFGDPILYGVALVDGLILARSGTELFAVKAR